MTFVAAVRKREFRSAARQSRRRGDIRNAADRLKINAEIRRSAPCRKADHAKVPADRAVAAAEEPFDQIAGFVQVRAEADRIFAVCLGRDIRPCILLADRSTQCVGIVALVRERERLSASAGIACWMVLKRQPFRRGNPPSSNEFRTEYHAREVSFSRRRRNLERLSLRG